jgi:5-methylcytosine-specific restriction endonuclease McrA
MSELKCENCGKPFMPRRDDQKYTCSKRCCRKRLKRIARNRKREALGIVVRECLACKKEFRPITRNHVFCCGKPTPTKEPKQFTPTPVKARKECPLCSTPLEYHQHTWCRRCAAIIDEHQRKRKLGRSRYEASPAYAPNITLITECEVCARPVGPGTWQRHHIIAREDGGTNDLSNIAVLCGGCHRAVHQSPLYAHAPGLTHHWARTRYLGPVGRENFIGICKMLDIAA